MIPRTYPTLIDGRKAGYMRVFYLTSVSGLTKWIDYIPVKTVAFSATAEGTTNANGHINVAQVSSSTALRKWVDYIPVFEDGSATVPWSTNANGYIPVNQMLDLDFRSGILDSRITFTRADAATCATYFDSTGRLQTATANTPRFDYDPATAAGVTGGELRSGFSAQLAGSAAAATFDSATGAGTVSRVDVNNQSMLRLSWTTGKTYAVSISNTGSSPISIRDFIGGTIFFTISAGASLTANVSSESGIRIQANSNGTVGAFTVNSVQEVTFTPRGLLIEESRQNLLLQSRDMTQAAWTKTDVTPARTQVGLDGVANTACLMTEGSAGTAQTRQTVGATANVALTGSLVVKRGNCDWFVMDVTDGTTDGVSYWFNIATGTVGTFNNIGTPVSSSATVVSLGGGWYRLCVTMTPDASATLGRMNFYSASANGNPTRVSGATYIVDCAQLEVGAFATSIIPTTTTALTRAADSASMTGTNFSSWFNQTEGTFVSEQTFGYVPSASQFPGAYSVSNGTSAESYQAYFTATNSAVFEVKDGGVSQAIVTRTDASPAKIASAYKLNDIASCVDGATVGTDTLATLPTPDRLYFGANAAGTTNLNGWLRSLRYYPTRLPNATLQALTT